MPKILVIEDNEMNLDMLMRRLVKRGYEVLTAVDGAAGIDLAKSALPDLILLDMSLPVVDGWTAVRQLKGLESTQKIPVIALTAHAVAGDREKCLAAGCDEYESKPIRFPELLAKVEQFVGAGTNAPE
ncbi:MAG: response regulator [Anaerolineae bacterium]|jgi:CheY-like chemotaxis protein|nr:response regulator [Anaerolineae bacterium]